MGVVGHVDLTQTPTSLTPSLLEYLDEIAAGSAEAYQPIVEYDDSPVAVVAYDPWINTDGTLLP